MAKKNPWLLPAGGDGFIPAQVLFDRLAAIYGQRWQGQFADDAAKMAWREEAAELLYSRGISFQLCKRGLDALRASVKADSVVVGIAEFAGLCVPEFDYRGAFDEAQRLAPLVGLDMPAEWSNQAIYWAARDFGFVRIQQVTWGRAKGDWLRILSGRLQGCPAVPVVEKKEYQPGDRGLAIAAIGQLKALLAGK
jgi:hypothetical protein